LLEDDEVRGEREAGEQPESPHISEVSSPNLWQRIRNALSPQERWSNLNWAIAAYPDEPTNYLLRGELLLHQGDTHGAMMDFRRAIELASAAVEQDDWGIAAQAVQDRALKGLQDAVRRAARYNSYTEPGDDN
jgi:hypothetical protein